MCRILVNQNLRSYCSKISVVIDFVCLVFFGGGGWLFGGGVSFFFSDIQGADAEKGGHCPYK